jgi:Flp pilus assembly protein CpaB
VENLLPGGKLGNLMPKGNVLGTPRRTFLVGVGAVLLAALLLLVYLRSYRDSVKSTSAPVTALVAKRFIPKGTTALALAKNGLFEVTVISKGSLKEGAITDAGLLRGQVALADIFPGQQLTIADFGVTATSSALSGVLEGKSRAIAITVDAQHGITPQVQTGDRVDVYTQKGGVLGLLKSNVEVLQAPNQVASGTTAPTSANFIFKVPVKDAPRFAFASQNTTLWFTLRGQKKVSPTPQHFVSDANLFSGSK